VGSHPRSECASQLSRRPDHQWRLAPRSRDSWRDAGLPPLLFDADAPPGRLLIDGELAQAVAPPGPLVHTEWVVEATCSSMHSSVVILGNPSEIGPQPEGVPVIAAHESDRHVAEIDRAYRQGTLALHGVGTEALAPFIRHNPHLPDPGTSRIWQVGVKEWSLRELSG